MKKKHILVVSQYFYPEQFRINDICTEWVKRGYRVTVITGIPNYPQGKFYDGFGWFKKRKEKWNGINVIRLPLIARGRSSIGMALNYFSFVVSGFVWKLFTRIKADYVFTFEVSPMTQALIGVWYAQQRHIPHYLYVQDLWPENVETVTGIHSPIVIKPIDRMVDYIYKKTDVIFTTSPSFVNNIKNRKNFDKHTKVVYWPQYAEEFYKPVEPKDVSEIPYDDSFKIIFTGNIGYAQGLDILPKTASLLKSENVNFVIVGDGRYMDEFKSEIQKYKVSDKFIMIPRQPAERIPELLCSCDVAFLSFMNTELFEMTIPAKLQSYMACGLPILAAASGETKRIIEEAKCGACSKIGDSKSLANSIKSIMKADTKTMSINSRDYFTFHFEKKKLMNYIDKYFN
jgi:glycosyltransferase involved in cell wall biosynthesis